MFPLKNVIKILNLTVHLFLYLSTGIDLFSGGYGDLYYPSNDMDPYLKKDKDDVSF